MRNLSRGTVERQFRFWLGLTLLSTTLCVLPNLPGGQNLRLGPSAVSAQESSDHRHVEADQLLREGIEQLHSGQTQQALETFQRELELRRQLGDREGEWRSLGRIGQIYQRFGQYQPALELYQDGLSIALDISDRRGEGMMLNNIGVIYDNLGEYQAALGYYERSLAIRQEIGDRRGEGVMLNNIGGIYSSLGEYQAALGYFERSLAIRQEIGDRSGEGISLNNIGWVLDQQGQPEMAIIFLKQSVNVREGIRQDIQDLSTEIQQSYTDTVADDYRFLADLLLSQGRIIEAQQVLELLKLEELRRCATYW